MSSRLTLNAGLRWDYEAPATETENQVNAGFDPNALALVCEACPASGLHASFEAVSPLPTAPSIRAICNNFGPRVGFTYQATQKLVARGGYGLTYLDSSTDRGTQTGYTRTTTYVASLDSNRTPSSRLSNPYPNGFLQPAGSSLGPATALGTGINTTSTTGVFRSSSSGRSALQYQLPWRSVLDVSYIGSATRKIGVNQPLNDLSREQILLGDAFLNELVPNPFRGLVPDGGARNTSADDSAPGAAPAVSAVRGDQ